jgi:hypothetical protein
MNIYEKLIKVQTELKAPKNQRNNFGGYNYRSCEDILEAVKPILKNNKLTLILKDNIVNIGDRYYIVAIADLIDIETGEKIVTQAQARESETKKGMDDSQITGTASSYARKYCLNGLFLIDDTKDADTNEYKKQLDNSNPKINETMVKALTEAIRNKEYTKKAVTDILSKYGYKELKDIETSNLSDIKRELEI